MEPPVGPGAADLSDGLGLLQSNSGALLYGVDQLTEGAWALRSGLGDLNRGAMALSEGTLQLRDGGKALQDGLDTFYKEGIVKLTSALQEKVPQMLDRFRAISGLSYETYAGLPEGVEGTVKFIYKTGGVDMG